MKKLTAEQWRKLALKKRYEHTEGFFDSIKPVTVELGKRQSKILHKSARRLSEFACVSYQNAVETIMCELLRQTLSNPANLKKLKKQGGAL